MNLLYLKNIIIISQNMSVPAPNTSMPIITQVRSEIPLEPVCFDTSGIGIPEA
jgi:hypothetical protein